MISESLLSQLGNPYGVTLLIFLLLLILYIINSAISVPYPKGIPLIREPAGATRFSLRTRLAYYTDNYALYNEAYNEYSKKGRAVIVPGVGVLSDIILPQKSFRWALSQPDNALNGNAAFAQFGFIAHAMGTDLPASDPWQGNLVKKDMNTILETIALGLSDELGVAFDTHFGTDTANWKEIDLVLAIRQIVAQAASRFTVGLPLCRNKEYLDVSFGAVDTFFTHPAICSHVPAILLPIVGRLSGLKFKMFERKAKKLFEPLYRERVQMLKYAKGDTPSPEPQDHLQMMLRYAQEERPEELNLDMITKRLLIANLGSYHQTAMQSTNILLNIIGSDPEFNTVAKLRDESARIIGSDYRQGWTRRNAGCMLMADSVMRETLRLHNFGGRNITRRVMTDGVVTEDGIKLPKNSIISFLSRPVHYDEEKFDEALKFDPFRFSRIREAAQSGGQAADGSLEANLKSASAGGGTAIPMAFVSTSADFLPFGHGKHACPGRFLVDFEMKMIITYVLMHYDIKFPDSYLGKRPENLEMAEVVMPPDGVKIMVKRRE